MKKAFTIILMLAFIIDCFLDTETAVGQVSFTEASLDSKLMYIIVTASLMGVIKLRRNAS